MPKYVMFKCESEKCLKESKTAHIKNQATEHGTAHSNGEEREAGDTWDYEVEETEITEQTLYCVHCDTPIIL